MGLLVIDLESGRGRVPRDTHPFPYSGTWRPEPSTNGAFVCFVYLVRKDSTGPSQLGATPSKSRPIFLFVPALRLQAIRFRLLQFTEVGHLRKEHFKSEHRHLSSCSFPPTLLTAQSVLIHSTLAKMTTSVLQVCLFSDILYRKTNTRPVEKESMSSPPSSQGPRFRPYASPNHQVTKGRYITSNDPRGYMFASRLSMHSGR